MQERERRKREEDEETRENRKNGGAAMDSTARHSARPSPGAFFCRNTLPRQRALDNLKFVKFYSLQSSSSRFCYEFFISSSLLFFRRYIPLLSRIAHVYAGHCKAFA